MNAIRPGYRHYVLGLLLTGYVLNSLDRSVLNLLLEPIRLEFGLRDTQLGLLSGPAFAIFYSALAIPVAVIADRGNRRNVLVISVLLWTMMTALCGLAGSFAALLLARIGVGMGEAGCNPPSHSLLADYYEPNRRATALGIYSLGAPVGVMLAGLIGGWGSEHMGWRATMWLAAAPGLLLVPLMSLSMREPQRLAPIRTRAAAAPSLQAALGYLLSRPSYRYLCVASALHSVAMYGASSFNPAYLTRSHGWNGAQVGQLITMTGLTGLAGAFLGGFITDRLGNRKNEARWQLWIPGIATLVVIPVQVVGYLGSGAMMVSALLASSLLSLVFFGPSYSTAQALAAPQMRALAASVLLFSKALVGMGLGPLLVGVASDLLVPVAGSDSLRLGLLLAPLFNLAAGICFFAAARHLQADLART